jgi:DNA invertase Pin-like site-specific DNA recombinase
MRLAVYARTSTRNGAGFDSLSAQEAVCRSWAVAHGHEITLVERDHGLSGRLGIDGRPGLAAALVAIQSGTADGLVVHRIDRLARELHIQEAALAQAWSAGEQVRVFEAVEGEIKRDDPDDPHRRFLRQVLGAAAELERGITVARLRAGKRRKSERGESAAGRPHCHADAVARWLPCAVIGLRPEQARGRPSSGARVWANASTTGLWRAQLRLLQLGRWLLVSVRNAEFSGAVGPNGRTVGGSLPSLAGGELELALHEHQERRTVGHGYRLIRADVHCLRGLGDLREDVGDFNVDRVLTRSHRVRGLAPSVFCWLAAVD